MTESDSPGIDLASELARIEADPVERASLAAAQLAGAIGSLMEQAIAAAPAAKQEIAAAMGVTPARVSQLLASDGNVRIATLARLLDACDFEITVVATPRGGGSNITVPLPSGTRTRQGKRRPAA